MALRGTGRDLLGNETETLQPWSLGQDAPLLCPGCAKSLSPHTSQTPTAMASSSCPPSPLLVRLPEAIPWARRKLEKYFQSRASGGGECSVQPVGPSAPDTFEVKFLQRAGEPGQGNWARIGCKGGPLQVSKQARSCFRGEPTRVRYCLWGTLSPTDFLHPTVGESALDVPSL